MTKRATGQHVIDERDWNLVTQVTGQHLVRIPAKIWPCVCVYLLWDEGAWGEVEILTLCTHQVAASASV